MGSYSNHSNLAALPELTWRLTRLGYAEYAKSFNPISIGRAQWMHARTPPNLSPLVRLFLQGTPVETETVPEIGDLIGSLLHLGVLTETATGMLKTPEIVLLPVGGFWLFVSRPQINPLLYLGDDSIGMSWRQSVKAGGSCLDLCSGPGLQALCATARASRVHAVEINPVSAALAAVNVAMNDCDRCEVFIGDLYEPVQGFRYDTVIANPPFIPLPASIRYPFVGNGGPDGLDVVRRILDGLPGILADDGIAQVVCAVPSENRRPIGSVVDELATWAKGNFFDLTLTMVGEFEMKRGGQLFEVLAVTAAHAFCQDLETVMLEIEQAYQEWSASHIATCFLHGTPGQGGLRLNNMSRPGVGLWFV